jgi:hypothetical protein
MTITEMARKGGRAGTGKAKARKVTSAQARHAANARWAKHFAALDTTERAARKLKLALK